MDSFTEDTNIATYRYLGYILDAMVACGVPLDMQLKDLSALNKMTHAFLTNPSLTHGELRGRTGLSSVKISRLVSSWQDIGWLEERIDPDDRRRRILTLSGWAKENSQVLTAQFMRIHWKSVRDPAMPNDPPRC